MDDQNLDVTTEIEEPSDDSSLVSDSPDQYEALTVSDYSKIAISSFPLGALSGAIFMIVGFAFLGIVKIFKKV